ncbi:TetR/AcrR family transcriptional regulator [Cumulibacter soli]|uniref:TetR/AcrR family transcriptional regulator n=1 Tax=Cumulibacter soli TaxID=2546344 RepID=UPI0010683471|nr:TetR/AcrR family transcriptional regulator [Cumulibacter soli]
MARTPGRSAGDTKRLILDAAAKLIGRHGTAVPISDIATAAGVSKGGLLYHFPSKESLLSEMAVSLNDEFRAAVQERAAQEPEDAPGRLARAYIRTSFAMGRDTSGLRDYVALAVHLMFEPGMSAIAQQDADWWRAALHGDGLDPAVVRIVVSAADGVSSGPLWGAVLSDADNQLLEAELIEMTLRSAQR